MTSTTVNLIVCNGGLNISTGPIAAFQEILVSLRNPLVIGSRCINFRAPSTLSLQDY